MVIGAIRGENEKKKKTGLGVGEEAQKIVKSCHGCGQLQLLFGIPLLCVLWPIVMLFVCMSCFCFLAFCFSVSPFAHVCSYADHSMNFARLLC
jgi:hypothetical protein